MARKPSWPAASSTAGDGGRVGHRGQGRAAARSTTPAGPPAAPPPARVTVAPSGPSSTPLGRGPVAQLGRRRRRPRVGQALADGPKPSPGVQNQGPSRRAPPGHPGQQPARGAGRHPAAGQLAGQLVGVEAPELAGVGEVEALAHGRPEPGPDDLGEGVGPAAAGPRRWRRRRPTPAANDGGSRRARSAGPQRERDPAALQLDAAVAGPALEVVAEQAAQVAEDAGVGRRVQPVAAVVDPDPVHLEAGRGPADPGGPLEHHDPVPGPGRPVGGGQPGRPRTEDDQVGRVSQRWPAGRPTVGRAGRSRASTVVAGPELGGVRAPGTRSGRPAGQPGQVDGVVAEVLDRARRSRPPRR